ncbi:hypothetical protein [Halobacillus aidingensis]|uniref:Glycosyltransferase involved in cell wall bisynthesis n=1 Tax=Halobacillus aidingensis TaxID=240303 RepID=A0A1H0KJJ7_HALAD|nr:hypothetical protein [Halobacillus aidingensis]SDO56118.1 Glycosyltransferase involved in cell wall bisynthesis [Halobacillus aidingensis]
MKIAYVVADSLEKPHGVSKKIYNQMKYWKTKGEKVKLFYFSKRPLNKMFHEFDYEIIKYNSRIDFVLNTKGFYVIKKWAPDIIYFRMYLYSISFHKMVKIYPSIIEINTDDVMESKISYPKIVRLFHLVTRNKLLEKAAGFVCVTYDLERKFKYYSNNTITIPNSVSNPFIGKFSNSKDRKERLQVIFLGSPHQPWHGLDKIKFLAAELSEVDFHIIGTNELENTTSNLIQYGFLSEGEYLEVLNKSDVAIGTLALHRNNMNEASPLKTREYLKYGVPVIIGYKDSDLLNKAHFVLELPNEENNIINNMSLIEKFIKNSRRIQILKSDVEHILSDSKEEKRLEFINEVIYQKSH